MIDVKTQAALISIITDQDRNLVHVLGGVMMAMQVSGSEDERKIAFAVDEAVKIAAQQIRKAKR